MDNNLKGGDEAGDAVGEKKGEDDVREINAEVELQDEFGCKICGITSPTKSSHSEHLVKNHSMGAIEIATEIVMTSHIEDDKKSKFKCEQCYQNFSYRSTLKVHMKCVHGEHAPSICNLCGIAIPDLKKHIEQKHFIHGGGKHNLSVSIESSEDSDNSLDSTDDETKVSTSIYKENEWGNEDIISEPQIGRNLKSKHDMFAVAATKLKQVYRKNSVKTIGDNTIHVTDVERKGTATEAIVVIEDKHGKGKILLTYWGPNKKTKETTIQVNTTKGSDKRLVNTFSEQFLKPVIDRITNGVGLGNFFKKKENAKKVCDACKTNFNFKTDLEDHKSKYHNEKSTPLLKKGHEAQKNNKLNLIVCDECEFAAESKLKLNDHITNFHSSEFWMVGSKRR